MASVEANVMFKYFIKSLEFLETVRHDCRNSVFRWGKFIPVVCTYEIPLVSYQWSINVECKHGR
jgi:hypothetical protein